MIDALPLLLSDEGYQISRSVRLRSSASAYLNRTQIATGNGRTWTWSGWCKRGILSINTLFNTSTGAGSSNALAQIYFDSSNRLGLFQFTGGTVYTEVVTTQVFRDPSAWYHIVIAYDDTQSTASNRVKMYVNGVQITAFSTATYPTQNFNSFFNTSTNPVWIGAYIGGPSSYFDGYLTEINFIDGQALTPASFGETNTVTGVWQPKRYTGTYGTNGFYLNFSDPSAATAAAIGKDYSGNGNNWTPNNISVTAGATYDSMLDVPTQWADGGNGRGNYATLNPVANPSTLLNANLTTNAGDKFSISTIGMTTGKWYCEVTVTTVGAESSVGISTQPYSGSNPYVGGTSTSWGYYSNNGNKYTNASNAAYGATYTTGDVISIAFDADNGTLEFFKNNTSQGTAYTGLTSGPYFFAVEGRTTTSANNCSINFGQRPFAYTPPSGFRALNTLNLPTPTILKGNQFFDISLYSGNSSNQTVTNSGGFQPDLVWVKSRNVSGNNHNLWDSARGAGKLLLSNLTDSEYTIANMTGFTSNGFSFSGVAADSNTTGNNLVGWQWKEGATQGFDIVTYTGTGVSGLTVNHSLGVKPAMIIGKNRSGAAQNWQVWHQSMGDNVMQLNLTNAQVASTANSVFLTANINSSSFQVGTNPSLNGSGTTHVAYLFAEVAGFSRFGSYTGNGSTDGSFVFCGFRPRYVMIKGSSFVSNWFVIDTSRSPVNVSLDALRPNLSDAETSTGTYSIDILSNGFKLRSSAADANTNGATFIYACFAENPFKNALAR